MILTNQLISSYQALVFTVCLFLTITLGAQDTPYLVILSMDGFRWDYPEKTATPNLDSIAAQGVKAKSIIPSFPTKTFPNHYTMVTGLYPDHHGIVQNEFYDPQYDRYYRIGNRQAVMDGAFYSGEPIWVTAEKQGLKSASYYWVGSEAEIGGVRPSYWKEYDGKVPFESRIDSVISWLNLPEDKRPHLILLYFDEPDGYGHTYGPESQAIIKKVAYLDSLVGVLTYKLSELSIYGEINLIVTSDHGMAENTKEKSVVLEDYISRKWFSNIQGYNPNYSFQVKERYRRKVMAKMNSIPHVMVWKHGEVPERLHYGSNPRTLDIILCAEDGWNVRMKHTESISRGAHGYDNANTDMHAIFYAKGPAFREGHVSDSFENVNLYPLMARILGLMPAATDGFIENVKNLLK